MRQNVLIDELGANAFSREEHCRTVAADGLCIYR